MRSFQNIHPMNIMELANSMKKYLQVLILFVSVPTMIFSQSQTVGIYQNDSLAFNGYTLFAPMNYNYVYLIDNCGYQVNQWECGNFNSNMAYLLEDGSMIRTGVVFTGHFKGGGLCGVVDCYTWDGDLLWDYHYHTENYHQHHDIEPLPDGNFLIIAWYKYTSGEAIANGKDPEMLDNELWMDHILEVEPYTGEIVWEWKAWDHLIQDFDAGKYNYGVVADHPERININYTDDPGPGGNIDWMHVNSVDYHAELDQIIISVRQYSEIWIIDHSTTTQEASGSTGGIYGNGGDLLYRWGNPEAYDRGGGNDQVLRYMHDANWIPDTYQDGGKIMVFNNEHEVHQSAVLIFDPPEDEPGFYTDPGDEAYSPVTYDWIYAAQNLFSRTVCGAQRLPDGNTLICEGQGGNFTEVTYEDKNLVWRYRSPVGMFGPLSQGDPPEDIMVFKILRYAPDFSGFEGKDLIPGDPVELDPWVYDCVIYEDTSTSSINILSEFGEIKVLNPFSNELNILFDENRDAEIQVYNMQGSLMISRMVYSNHVSILTHSWPDGIYVLKVKSLNFQVNSFKVFKCRNWKLP